jgi:hypothetical protein
MDRTDTGLLATGPATGGGGGGGGKASSFAVHKQNSFKLNAFSFIVLSIAAKSMSGSPSPRDGMEWKRKKSRHLFNLHREKKLKETKAIVFITPHLALLQCLTFVHAHHVKLRGVVIKRRI